MLTTLILFASFIPAAPTLQVECGFYDFSADCVPGTRVYFLWEPLFGMVPQTEMLFASRPDSAVELPSTVPYPGRRVDALPEVASAPEPDGTLIVIAGLLGMLIVIARTELAKRRALNVCEGSNNRCIQ